MNAVKKRTTEFSKPEISYRDIPALNQSMLCVFDENPMQFYNEFVLGNKKKSKSSSSFEIGDLADFYLLDCNGDEQEFNQRLDEKFVLMEGNKSTAQAFVLADNLFDISLRDADEDGLILTDFTQRFIEAFSLTQKADKYKGKTWEQGLVDFNKTAKDYFDKKIAHIGKTVVGQGQIEKAMRMIEQLINDEFLGDYINQHTDGTVEVLKKVPIEFEHYGWECKAEIDFLHINHHEKIIYRRDLKTAYDNESFEYSYIKYYYYIQNAFYYLAAKSFAIQNGLDDYQISPMDFLVLDTSANNRRPLLYQTTNDHVYKGLVGFNFMGNHYRGVNELIAEISWARDNGIWNISKTNYLNKGIVQLKSYE